jgi:hypothetical protein
LKVETVERSVIVDTRSISQAVRFFVDSGDWLLYKVVLAVPSIIELCQCTAPLRTCRAAPTKGDFLINAPDDPFATFSKHIHFETQPFAEFGH